MFYMVKLYILIILYIKKLDPKWDCIFDIDCTYIRTP